MAITMHSNDSRFTDMVGYHPRSVQTTVSDQGGFTFVKPGDCLVEGDIYLDLSNPGKGPFRAMKWQCAGSKNRFVAAAQLSPARWDLLVRMTAYTGLASSLGSLMQAPDFQH